MTNADRDDPVRLVAGRVVRAHGLRGEVVVDVRSDDADRRFTPGASLITDPGQRTMRIASLRRHQGRLLVVFDGVGDRDAAEALRGTSLLVDVSDELAAPDDSGEWFVVELVGCRVLDTAGIELGRISAVRPGAAQDLLVVTTDGPQPQEVLVPFVAELVPHVDVAARTVVVAPPGGLFDPTP